ncbi:MAG: leucine--tRNA ligase [Candidatus Zixiibacteriota bacterium]
MDTTDQTSKRRYDFSQIESKWQKIWQDSDLYRAADKPDPNNKFYMLVMFAYPSGDIHMGHFRNYIIGDAVARYQMMLGKDVLHPFGWDAFGLPAERAAISRGIHPSKWTEENIEVSRATLQKVGISFDWSREIASSAPDYYKWTQWMFLELFKKGLAYRKRGFVNWCPEDKTVLANEQVKDGRCERCDTEIEKKEQVQWYFKITEYADRLVDDLDKLPDWPDNVKAIQREWIGRSYGLEVDFTVEGTGEKLPIFTTRPDTIFGVTFMAIAPEAELLKTLPMDDTHAQAVREYQKKAARRSDIERSAAGDEKDGVFTGCYVVNPFNGERVQLWVADYVLAGYGTGAVMAVPAHDSRDFAFAKKYSIPIKVVIHPDADTAIDPESMDDAYTEYGTMVNSGQFDGQVGSKAVDAVSEYAEQQGIGCRKVNYRLKDWSISRQRYWGCPIPIIHCEKCGEVPVPEESLPVKLPQVEEYTPKGRSPLADVADFVDVACPECGGEARRDPDTMDTFVCSSWYYLRYIDPHNQSQPFAKDKAVGWMPVDLYVGGITHATGHLLYFRFFQKFLKDIGWATHDEPARRLFNHGMVMDSKGEVMSKSLGNVVSPISVMANHGIDVTRLAMFFTAPSEREVMWSEDTIRGLDRFVLNRLFPISMCFRDSKVEPGRLFEQGSLSESDFKYYVKLNQTISRVTGDIERLQFNTVIAALMELLRDFGPSVVSDDQLNDKIVLNSIQLIAPMAPHLAEELWQAAGNSVSVFKSKWPLFDPNAITENTIEIAVQINGKLRDTVRVLSDAGQEAVEKAAFASEKIQSRIGDREIVKTIFVKGRILNIVVKG